MAQPLRIVSYNVRYFGHAVRGLASTRAGKRGIAGAIAGLWDVPDVVCLQEVETSSLRSNIGRPRPHPEQTQLESFMDGLADAFAERGVSMPFDAYYFRAHTYKLGDISLYTTGLAVLVNRRTLEVGQTNVRAPAGITHYHVQRWKDRKQSRICAHLHLREPSGRTFHVFNTHLSLPSPFAREYWSIKEKMGHGINQLHEAERLVEFVHERARGGPFVICGDFNSPPGSPVYRLLRDAGFHGAEEEAGLIDPSDPRAFPTAGFLRLRMHLDHIFFGGGMQLLDLEGTLPFGAGPFAGLSDHMPIIGRFVIGPRPDRRQGPPMEMGVHRRHPLA